MSPSTDARAFLRHTLATLAYRAEKVLRDAPTGFADFRVHAHGRTPLELVSHLGDLLEWGERMARGEVSWQAVPQRTWDAATARFFTGLQRFDATLAGPAPLGKPAEALFQGPIADALTHVGQLAMLRGMAGQPIRPESYARARIEAGRVGREQSSERIEFDGDASRPRS